MLTYPRMIACVAAMLAAGAASAQNAPACPRGEADEKGINVRVTVPWHPTRVADALDSVLVAQGYTVAGAPADVGSWQVEPRFTWPEAAAEERWHGEEHPGVQLFVDTEEADDSTKVTVGARALCRVQGPAGDSVDVGTLVEVYSATMLAGALTERLDSARAAGVDPSAPVQRNRASVPVPEAVAGFRFQGQHQYEDRRLGTNVRYARDDGMYLDVYLYGGFPVNASCNAACAVNQEADGFIAGFPELLRAGTYESLDVTGDRPLQPPAGAPWAFGRHLSMKVRRDGRVLDSQYYLFAFPAFKVKVRATYPPSEDTLRDVDAFVADLLPKLVAPGR